MLQIDAHNIVPVWIASDKQEVGARTIRKKIHDKLDEYLTDFPPVIKHPYASKVKPEVGSFDIYLYIQRERERVEGPRDRVRDCML